MTKPRTGRASKFTPQTIQNIKEMVAQGLSRDEIAQRLDVTVGSLQVTCSRLGVSLRRPRMRFPSYVSRKVLCHRSFDEHAHELTKANFADLCLERQFSNIFIGKAQLDRLFVTSVLHRQGEVRAACLLVPEFATWYRNIFFLSSLQRLINIRRGDLRLRYRYLCPLNCFCRHAFGGTQPSLLQVEKMCLLGWHGGHLGGALRLLGTPIALVDQTGGHDRNTPVACSTKLPMCRTSRLAGIVVAY